MASAGDRSSPSGGDPDDAILDDIEFTVTAICSELAQDVLAQEDQAPEQNQSPAPKQRGRKKGFKLGAVQKPLSSRDTLIKARCSVETAMNFFHKKVLRRLNDDHFFWLMKTPFLHLFCFPMKPQVSSAVLHHILSSWDEAKGEFHFKGKKLRFVPEEVSLFMGLPFNGDPVTYDRSSLADSEIRRKYFTSNVALKSSELESKILECLSDGSPAEDVVSLLIMYIFTMILFPQAGVNVPVNMFYYVDNLDLIREYSWGKAVYNHLFDQITSCSRWCKEMDRIWAKKGKGQSVGKRKRGKNSDSRYMPGCVIALMVWWYEHIQFKEIERHNGAIPRYLNWKLDTTFTRKKLERMLEKVPAVLVKAVLIKPTAPEKLIYMEGMVPEDYLDILKDNRNMARFSNLNLKRVLRYFAPTFRTFGMEVCDSVMCVVSDDSLKEIDYNGSFGLAQGEIPLSLEMAFAGLASRTERERGIHVDQAEKKRREKGSQGAKKKVAVPKGSKQVVKTQRTQALSSPKRGCTPQKDVDDDDDFEPILTRNTRLSSSQNENEGSIGSQSQKKKIGVREQTVPIQKLYDIGGKKDIIYTRRRKKGDVGETYATPIESSGRLNPKGKNDSSVYGKNAPHIPKKSVSKNISKEVTFVGVGEKQLCKGGKNKRFTQKSLLDYIPYSDVVKNTQVLKDEDDDEEEDEDEVIFVSSKPGQKGEKKKLAYVEKIPYFEWHSIFVLHTQPEGLEFILKSQEEGTIDSSLDLFADPGEDFGPKPFVVKERRYCGRDLVSDKVSKNLDHWVCCLWSGHFCNREEPAYHDEKSLNTFSVHELARVLYGECIAVEVVDAWFHYMQRYIPTKHPWFYISGYYAKMLTEWDMEAVLKKYPYFFTESANSMSWLFIPLIGEDHFVLLAADVHHVKLMMFNSLPDSRNMKYEEMHHATIKWVRQFLYWRMDNFKWKTVKIEWQRGIPKQYSTLD